MITAINAIPKPMGLVAIVDMVAIPTPKMIRAKEPTIACDGQGRQYKPRCNKTIQGMQDSLAKG
jgi:hypothetical protein